MMPHHNPLSQSERTEVLAAVARSPALAALVPASGDIERLAGLTNRNYRIELAGGAIVLRLPGPGTERYIDRRAERHNAAIAAEIGLGPEVLFFDPASGIMLTRYAEDTEPLTARRLRDAPALHAAVGMLARLHRSGRQFHGQMDLFPKLDAYLALAAEMGQPAPATLLAARESAEPVRRALDRLRQPLAPCHIDPSPHNFLVPTASPKRGKTVLLDWEYAAMGEPLWDLAGLSVEGEFDDDQDAAMLREHGAGASSAGLAHLRLYKGALALLAAAWAQAQRALGADNDVDYGAFRERRLDLARRWIGGDVLDRSVNYFLPRQY
jgi:thiamine kinase-like enzyme